METADLEDLEFEEPETPEERRLRLSGVLSSIRSQTARARQLQLEFNLGIHKTMDKALELQRLRRDVQRLRVSLPRPQLVTGDLLDTWEGHHGW